jgi:hypothetical protein
MPAPALQLADQMGLLFGGCQPELMDEKIGFNDVGRRWQDVGHQVLGLDDAMILRATNGDLRSARQLHGHGGKQAGQHQREPDKTLAHREHAVMVLH